MAVVPGVNYTVSPAQVNLPAYGTTLVAVTMEAESLPDEAHAPIRPFPLTPAAGYSWLSEAAGYVVLTPGFKYNVYLPLMLKAGDPRSVPRASLPRRVCASRCMPRRVRRRICTPVYLPSASPA